MGRRADERPRGARQGRSGRERRGGDARRGRALRQARRPKARAGSPGSGAARPRARRPWESRADRVRERLARGGSAGAACGRPRRPRDRPRRAAATRSPSSRRGPRQSDRRTGLALPGPSTRGPAWGRYGRWRVAPGPGATAGVRSPRAARPRAAVSPESPPPAPAWWSSSIREQTTRASSRAVAVRAGVLAANSSRFCSGAENAVSRTTGTRQRPSSRQRASLLKPSRTFVGSRLLGRGDPERKLLQAVPRDSPHARAEPGIAGPQLLDGKKADSRRLFGARPRCPERCARHDVLARPRPAGGRCLTTRNRVRPCHGSGSIWISSPAPTRSLGEMASPGFGDNPAAR